MFKLKKSLGQNFFNNPLLADKICAIATKDSPKQLIEIGPGDGYFTQRLSNKVENITVIEKDTELATNLAIKFPNIKIVNEDVLDYRWDLQNITPDTVIYGSLPYNISKHIIRKLLENTNVTDMYFIIQKEVAQKYTGKEKSSLQYITTKLYADCKIEFNINPGSFIPAPKVDSSFIHIKRNGNIDNIDNPTKFLSIIKMAFNNPRKTLRNNFKLLPNIERLDDKILNLRAQNISFDEFINIYNLVK